MSDGTYVGLVVFLIVVEVLAAMQKRRRNRKRAIEITAAMLLGHRPKVVRPPRGQTHEEAQAEVDALFELVREDRKRDRSVN